MLGEERRELVELKLVLVRFQRLFTEVKAAGIVGWVCQWCRKRNERQLDLLHERPRGAENREVLVPVLADVIMMEEVR